MVLKDLDEALRDGDTIRAVIRGTGSNQDGKRLDSLQHRSYRTYRTDNAQGKHLA